jgi:hypothetical protein
LLVPNNKAPVAQWIERLFPKQKVIGSTPIWRVLLFASELFFFFFFLQQQQQRRLQLRLNHIPSRTA